MAPLPMHDIAYMCPTFLSCKYEGMAYISRTLILCTVPLAGTGDLNPSLRCAWVILAHASPFHGE